MSDSLLGDDPFNSEQSQKLFEVIDELHSCGAKAYVDLPEIVIVGDQSSGKSSLLQSLTEIPFPVAGRLCTRFPTRIVSRRTPGGSDVTKISIEASTSGFFPRIPDPTSDFFPRIADPEREAKYAKFRPVGINLSENDFTTAVDDAMRLMGIAEDPAANGDAWGSSKKPNFSSDVLRIELSGPDRSHFSILDVPGVFQSRTKDVTLAEMDGVKNLVSAEMRRKQSIVVCVASATSDLATQAIFEMSSKEDPNGDRTVGVITKCDVTQHPDLVVRLAQNDRDGDIQFQNGWFVVRNRTPTEAVGHIEPLERHNREKNLFNSAPWNTLPSSRRGVQALKKHLGDLLYDRMQAAFPKMLSDIQERIKSTSLKLDSLGSARSTKEQKRAYLTKIAQRFNSIALGILRGRYESIENNDLKLRKEVRDANGRFMHRLTMLGHRLPFMALPIVQHLQSTSHKRSQAATQSSSSSSISAPSVSNQASGTSGGVFGLANSSNVGSKVPWSTVDWPFVAPLIKESDSYGSRWTYYQSIPSTSPFQHFSFEELRLKDYVQGLTKSNHSGSGVFGGGGIFGTPNAASLAPSTVGNSSTPATSQNHTANQGHASIFGNPSTPLFGSVPNNTSTAPTGATTDSAQRSSSSFPPLSTAVPASSAFGRTGVLFGPGSINHDTPVRSSKPEPSSSLFVDKSDPQDAEIYRWIRKEIKDNRGTELQGTLNPDVLPMLFHQQASKWGGMAENHFLDVVDCSSKVLSGILRSVACDEITRNRIWPRIKEASDQAENLKMALLRNRFREITSRHLQTSNTAFETKVAEARLLRFQAALDRYRISKQDKNAQPAIGASEDSGLQFTVDMRDTAALFVELHMSNSRNLENEIHDTLKAYYEIARDDFIEFVTQHIVESFINSDDGPVLCFSPVYVASLSDEDIEDLGMEDQTVSRKRVEREATLERLKHAERIALKYA